ncbi:hypothetical protein [Pseudomonas frederiksbergensis]|uniref:hypothetical protein n=1 Tax=Pseudomonas frederiksbergensis TaxID=104087 RepID=UPI0011B0741E|nr:hypothetical protein [Pseudomonas frederiksbergensis]
MTSLNYCLSRLRGEQGVIAFGDSEDWCVTRFDSDDDTLEVYWSEPNAPYRRTSASQHSEGVFRPWGGHAEMQMIRGFQESVVQYGAIPYLVEIFISRSPCSRSQAFNVAGHVYPVGCGRKILELVNVYPAVSVWKVVYNQVFSGSRNAPDEEATAQAEFMINRLNQHPRVEALLWAEYQHRLQPAGQ